MSEEIKESTPPVNSTPIAPVTPPTPVPQQSTPLMPSQPPQMTGMQIPNMQSMTAAGKSKNIRCLSCGHFLLEIITETAVIKTLCRQARCKTVNYVVIDKGQVHASVEEKRKVLGYGER
jgi:phage FluMu protein Com